MDEVDNELKTILNSIKRNKKLVGFFTLGTIFLGTLFAFTAKPVWEATFQIVLNVEDEENKLPTNNLPANLQNFIGTRSGSELKTQVQILQSTSILKPIFDYIVDEKEKKEGKLIDLKYNNWKKKNIKVKLIEETKVLDFKLRGNHKDIIMNAINKVSEEYQIYSRNKKEEELNKYLEYLDNQIMIYRNSSLQSLSDAQEYGINNNLNAITGELNFDLNLNPYFNTDLVRAEATNNIRELKEKIKQLRKIQDLSTPAPLTTLYPLIIETNLYLTYQNIEKNLINKKIKYKPNDIAIKLLREQKKALLSSLKEMTLSGLNAQLIEAETKKNSSTRPKNIIKKYNELIRKSYRDNQTLNNLEDSRTIYALEKANQKDLWKLISIPELSDEPVYPEKSKIIFLSLILGLLLGSSVALVSDERSNIIYSFDELKKLIPYKYLFEINNFNNLEDLLIILEKYIFNDPKNDEIEFFLIGSFNEQIRNNLETKFNDLFDNKKIIFNNSTISRNINAQHLLITGTAILKRKQLNYAIKNFNLQDLNLVGWINIK